MEERSNVFRDKHLRMWDFTQGHDRAFYRHPTFFSDTYRQHFTSYSLLKKSEAFYLLAEITEGCSEKHIIFLQFKSMAKHQNSLAFAFFPPKRIIELISRDHKRQTKQISAGFKQASKLKRQPGYVGTTHQGIPAWEENRAPGHPLEYFQSVEKKAFPSMTMIFPAMLDTDLKTWSRSYMWPGVPTFSKDVLWVQTVVRTFQECSFLWHYWAVSRL